MRYLLTTLFVFCWAAGLIAGGTSPSPFDSLPAPLKLIARPHGDSITLRWAPTSYPAWSQLRRYGVVVERRQLGSGTGFAAVPGERRIALSLEGFRTIADTSNVHVVAVAEAMYGEATPGTNEGPLGRAKDVHEEQSQRLFLALLNADLSAKAADALGWRYVDRNVRRGYDYEYRLRLLAPVPRYSEPLRVRPAGNFYAGPVLKVRGEVGDGQLRLIWPRNINESSFVAYRLEVSDDGDRWRDMIGLPLLPEPEENDFGYTIREVPNGTERYYRLRGINSFGELCKAGEGIKLSAQDQAPPPPPFSVNGKDLRDGRNELYWTVDKNMPADLAGYRVLRGLSATGKLVPAHADLLPADQTTWTDPTPFADRNNYYAVEAVDQAGNAARSPVNFVQRWDDTPPNTPLGLTGRIDTTGRVFLLWEPGTEPDLLGYRVYRSHARNREFLQLTSEVQHRNFFFDSTSLFVLNETVLYRIVAVDRHYNPSPYSAILELRRPDKIAPSAPKLSGFSARNGAVELRIRPSSSSDVVRQTVWRNEADKAAIPLAVIGARDSIFVDTTVAARTLYAYSVRAEDEVGLSGTSRRLTIRTGVPTVGRQLLEVARTQVQGKDGEVLRWIPPAGQLRGYQLFAGPTNDRLRPLRRLGPDDREWSVPDPSEHYALRVIYADGSQSPLSTILAPLNR